MKRFFAASCAALGLILGVLGSPAKAQTPTAKVIMQSAPVVNQIAAPATTPVKKGPQPKMVFTSLKWDFGDVEESGDITHLYHFRNTGRATLNISGVHPSCGCTAANTSHNDIPPGGSGSIKVTYHTQGRPGKAVKTITVSSNDPDQPSITLTFNVNVLREIDIQPDRAYFYGVRKGQGRSVTISVLGKPGHSLKVLSAEPRQKKVTVQLSPLTQPEDPAKPLARTTRHGASLVVTLPNDLPFGDISDEIVVKTSDAKKPEVVIPVQGDVLGRVQVFPKQVYFGNLDQPITMTITADPPEGFVIRSVSTEKHLVKPWVHKIHQPNGQDMIQVVVSPPNPKSLPVGAFQDNLLINSNDTEQPTITVPVNGTKNP